VNSSRTRNCEANHREECKGNAVAIGKGLLRWRAGRKAFLSTPAPSVSKALYYALGGGFGHLARTRAVLEALGEAASGSVRVVASVDSNAPPALIRGLDLLPIPAHARNDPASFGPWLRGLLHRLRPRTLYLDCFPAGLFGELCGMELPEGLRIVHLARLLRWDKYHALLQGDAPRLHLTYRLEPLRDEHERWLVEHSQTVQDLAFRPSVAVEEIAPDLRRRLEKAGRPLWVVVHSGPDEEIEELLAYGREMAAAECVTPCFVLVAPRRPANFPANVLHLSCFPARPLFPLADRIITACGFNLMAETAPYRAIHRFLPMPRRFDDQFARAAMVNAAALGGRIGS